METESDYMIYDLVSGLSLNEFGANLLSAGHDTDYWGKNATIFTQSLLPGIQFKEQPMKQSY